MASEKDLAIVLRTVEWSETSLVLTLFTREFGKVQALAKGARRPKGPFESALDLLSVTRVVFLHKSSDALDLLTEARLERRFRPPGRDLSRLYGGYYVAELLDSFTTDDDPHPELFDAAEKTLALLSREGIPLSKVVLRFELATLAEAGHLPALDGCAECGVEIVPQGRIAFGMLSGGVLCGKCRVAKRQIVSVSAEGIRLLSMFAQPGEAWREYETDSRAMGEVRGIVNRYLWNLLGKRMKMHEHLAGLLN